MDQIDWLFDQKIPLRKMGSTQVPELLHRGEAQRSVDLSGEEAGKNGGSVEHFEKV